MAEAKTQIIFGILIGTAVTTTIFSIPLIQLTQENAIISAQIQERNERIQSLEIYLQGYKEGHLGSNK